MRRISVSTATTTSGMMTTRINTTTASTNTTLRVRHTARLMRSQMGYLSKKRRLRSKKRSGRLIIKASSRPKINADTMPRKLVSSP